MISSNNNIYVVLEPYQRGCTSISFSDGHFMRVWDPHLFMWVSRPVFEKPGITPVFVLIVLKGFTMVFNDGIDNRSPLYVAIIPNHDGNDSVVSYSHMIT